MSPTVCAGRRSTKTGLGGEAAAALAVLGHESGLSIVTLSEVLRLSHAGTVRIVDRLVEHGFATRAVAEHDQRSVTLSLTALGREARAALLARRHVVLADILSGLDAEDRTSLERIAEQVLRGIPADAVSALNVCRLCDEGRCRDCPMEIFGPLEQGRKLGAKRKSPTPLDREVAGSGTRRAVSPRAPEHVSIRISSIPRPSQSRDAMVNIASMAADSRRKCAGREVPAGQ